MSSKQRLLELNARLAQNLTDKGVEATAGETTTALVNKVADIKTGDNDTYYDIFWDAYQQNNTRSNYANAFYGRGWTDVTFKPKYDITVTASNAMFSGAYITDLKNILAQQGVVLDLSQSTNVSSIFAYCPNITEIPPLDFGKVERNGGGNLFRDCRQLVSIEITNVPEYEYHTSYNIWNQSFNNCTSLKNLTITGVISNSMNLSQCPELSLQSVNSIINALKKYDDSNSRILTLHSNVKANLTSTQISAITNKNWTLA